MVALRKAIENLLDQEPGGQARRFPVTEPTPHGRLR